MANTGVRMIHEIVELLTCRDERFTQLTFVGAQTEISLGAAAGAAEDTQANVTISLATSAKQPSQPDERTVDTVWHTSTLIAPSPVDAAVQIELPSPLSQLSLTTGRWTDAGAHLSSSSAPRVLQLVPYASQTALRAQACVVLAGAAREAILVEWMPESRCAVEMQLRAAQQLMPRLERESGARSLGPAVLSPRVELFEASRVSASTEYSVEVEDEEERDEQQELHDTHA